MKTKIFKKKEIKDGHKIYVSIIVSLVPYWDGKKKITRSYLNYIVLGFNWPQEWAYDHIIAFYPELLERAEKYAENNSDVIYFR